MLYTKCYSGDQIKRNEIGGARKEQRRGAYVILLGKPEGKRPLGRPRLRRKHDVRMDFPNVG